MSTLIGSAHSLLLFCKDNDLLTAVLSFQFLVHGLTDTCWELCIDKPSSRLDNRTENCLNNCVERFIDTTNFIVNRLEKTQQFAAVSSDLSFE